MPEGGQQSFSSHALDDVVKMIPAEVLVFWSGVWGVLLTTTFDEAAYLTVFVVAAVGTYLWMKKSVVDGGSEKIEPWALRYQCVTAVMAFVVWAYYLASLTTGVPVTSIPLDRGTATIVLWSFAFMVPLLPLFAVTVYGVGKLLYRRGKREGPASS